MNGRIQEGGNRCELPARMSGKRVLMVKPCVRQGPLETRRAARRVSENNLPLLPLNLALVNDGRTFAAAKAKVQPRPELSRMRLLCLEANKQSTNSGAMLLSRK